MLEKGGRFAVRIFPEGLVLSQDCSNFICIYFPGIKSLWKIHGFANSTHIHISPYHTLCMAGRYIVFVRDMYASLHPRNGALFH